MPRLRWCHNNSSLTLVYIALVACFIGFPVAAQSPNQGGAATAAAEIKNPQGQTIGRADLVGGPKGIVVKLRLDKATEGEHAIHIHETGKCEAPTFESAGNHFNPTGATHGVLSAKGPHAGDLPNLRIPPGESIELELFVVGAQLGGENSLLDADGAAIVLHAKPDDHRTDPAGNAGDRIACGVIP
jgi:superoxide dismutase, Cu-Zn family